jgi:hypothetical protein
VRNITAAYGTCAIAACLFAILAGLSLQFGFKYMACAFIYTSGVSLTCAVAGYLNNGVKFQDVDKRRVEELRERRQWGM